MRLNELRLSDDERLAVRSIDRSEATRVTDEALATEDPGVLHALSALGRAGAYVEGRRHRFEQYLREARSGRTAGRREEARRMAPAARDALLGAVEAIRRRADAEEAEDRIFRVVQPAQALHQDYPVRVRVPFSWKDDASGEWKRGSVTYVYDPPGAPPAGGRRNRSGLTRREDRAADAEADLITSAIESVQDFLRARGTGEGIPERVLIRDDVLNNFSTSLLPRAAEGGNRTG